MDKRPGWYSKVPTSDWDEVIEMEQPGSYSASHTEKQESGLSVAKANCRAFWCIITAVRRLFSCFKVIIGVMGVVSFFGVLYEGRVLYTDHNRINSLIENSKIGLPFNQCLFESEQCEIGSRGNGDYWKACPTKFVPKEKEVNNYYVQYLKVVIYL